MNVAESRPRIARRIVAGSAAGFAVLAIAAIAWSLTSLRGLPDVGDPFDVAAFVSYTVRDEDNAFVLYRQADELFRKWDGTPTYDWPKATDAERRWLEQNRPVLEVWRRGTERPNALFFPPGVLALDAKMEVIPRLRDLAWLACFEGTRLEAEGDVAGAWGWYRAVLRASRQWGRRSGLLERLIGVAMHHRAADRITAWASRPDVDAKALRAVLAEVRAIDAATAPMSEAVKGEYLNFLDEFSRPELTRRLLEEVANGGVRTGRAPIAKVTLLRAGAFLGREPERSRRLLRLVVANWLPFCDLPLAQRPPLDPSHGLFYLAGPSTPPDARRLSPERMAAWYDSTTYLRYLIPGLSGTRKAVDRERATQAALVIHLASELYRREHGDLPNSPEVLVGPYLEALPAVAVPQ